MPGLASGRTANSTSRFAARLWFWPGSLGLPSRFAAGQSLSGAAAPPVQPSCSETAPAVRPPPAEGPAGSDGDRRAHSACARARWRRKARRHRLRSRLLAPAPTWNVGYAVLVYPPDAREELWHKPLDVASGPQGDPSPRPLASGPGSACPSEALRGVADKEPLVKRGLRVWSIGDSNP